MANDLGTALLGLLTLIGGFTVLHYLGLSLIVKVGLALAAAVGVISLYKLSQGGSLDSAAADIKSGTRKAVNNADYQANRAADGIKQRANRA